MTTDLANDGLAGFSTWFDAMKLRVTSRKLTAEQGDAIIIKLAEMSDLVKQRVEHVKGAAA